MKLDVESSIGGDYEYEEECTNQHAPFFFSFLLELVSSDSSVSSWVLCLL